MCQEHASIPALVERERAFGASPEQVVLSGVDLSVAAILAVARGDAHVAITPDSGIRERLEMSTNKMLEDVRAGVAVYGVTSAYGGQASRVFVDGCAEERMRLARRVSEAIVMTDVSVGPAFQPDVVRAAILIRVNMLLRGVSAIKASDLELYCKVLNLHITPIVNQYGGLGASGDLAHNSRVLSAARQLPGVKVWDRNGTVREAQAALSDAGVSPLVLDPKAGLGLVNGDNFSTSLATLLAVDTLQALLLSTVSGALAVEVLGGSMRMFHPMLAELRAHPGQAEVAGMYRFLLEGSDLARQDLRGHTTRETGAPIQDAYSLRCIAQYHAFNFERLSAILDTIQVNANSVSDNPLWVSADHVVADEPPGRWLSGGNFLAMHMAESIDSLRKIMTQIVKLNDRHLARMVHPGFNGALLPANLSDADSIAQCTFKGVQIQAGMFDVYSSLLSMPVTTFFGSHEEHNQDVTSHALTSGILGLENLRIARYSTAQILVALAQAVDLRGGPERLSPRTRPIYKFVRSGVGHVSSERPLNADIEAIYESICNGTLMSCVRNEVFDAYQTCTA